MDTCIGESDTILERQSFWNEGITLVRCESLGELETYMGHQIAMQIKLAKERGEKIAFILPLGPMGMYKWVVYFIKAWGIKCDHVYTLNMDEWADGEGNTLGPTNHGSFQYAMENALFNPLGELTVPREQSNFATKSNLPTYPEKIQHLRLRAQSWSSSTVSAECVRLHSGSLPLLRTMRRHLSGRRHPTE